MKHACTQLVTKKQQTNKQTNKQKTMHTCMQNITNKNKAHIHHTSSFVALAEKKVFGDNNFVTLCHPHHTHHYNLFSYFSSMLNRTSTLTNIQQK
jgi:hypothetical protein